MNAGRWTDAACGPLFIGGIMNTEADPVMRDVAVQEKSGM
jgi:hypothetical protein